MFMFINMWQGIQDKLKQISCSLKESIKGEVNSI